MHVSLPDPIKHIRNLLAESKLQEAAQLLKDLLPRTSAIWSDFLRLQNQINQKENSFSDAEIRLWSNRILDLLRRWQNDPDTLIEIAHKSRARFLDLGKCSLSALPETMAQLQSLEELNLGSVYWDDDLRKFSGTRNDGAPNDFSNEDFSVLQNLPNLRKLSVRGCNISTLEHLSELTQLTTLSVGQSTVSNIEPLRKMTRLQVLSLFDNKIEDITPLAGLHNLTMLSLNNNYVRDINALAELKNLRELHLAGNNIDSIRALSNLFLLEDLNLADNQIPEISQITKLTALSALNLRGNPVKDCPPEIAFSGDFALIKAYFQAASGAKSIINIPDSVFEKQTTSRQYRRKQASNTLKGTPGSTIPILEVKLILVGNSSAGKTSVSNLLRNVAHNTREETTHGIQVSEWWVDTMDFAAGQSTESPEYRMKVNIWDFGGQEYYHETHRIFLDSNAVYLLVWDQLTNTNQSFNTNLFLDGEAQHIQLEHFHFQYWLDNIRFHTTAAKPPIILLENKIDLMDGRSHWHDRQMLLDYDIRLTAAISARFAGKKSSKHKRYRYGFEIFKEDLLSILLEKAEANARIANLPSDWVRIRDTIRNYQISKDPDNPFQKYAGESTWLNTNDFDETCKKLGESICEETAGQLKKYLHQTGAIVWLPEIDSSRIYLNPQQLTARMYQVLNNKVRQKNGVFNIDDIISALDNPEEAYRMLQLMKTWDLIFPHPTLAQTWLAPQYLPEQHPMENLFNIALTGLQENFIMVRAPLFHVRRMMRHLALRIGANESVEASEYWKFGMLFAVAKDQQKIRIFIKSLPQQSDSTHGQLMLCVEPGKNLTDIWKEWLVRELLKSYVRHGGVRELEVGQSEILLREIAQSQHELSLSLDGNQFVSVEKLVLDADAGFSAAITKDGGRVPMKNFTALLRAVEIEPPIPSIFISYAHADNSFREALETHLEPMNRLGIAMNWSDVQIVPGQEWNEAILGQLRSADVILLLLSPDALASDYIWKTEIPEAMIRHLQGRCRIVPVLLRPCDWTEMPFAKIEMTPKHPQTNKLLAISSWTDRDEAMNTVVEAVKATLREMSVQ